MAEINSRRNDRIRLARALRRPKGRREHERFLVEGIRHIGELLDSDFETDFLLYAPESLKSAFGNDLLTRARAGGITAFSTTPEILDSLSEKQQSSGLLAIAHKRGARLADVFRGGEAWAAAITAPQDPGNIGTILRTMDAFGFGGLILLDGGADPWQPACVRASMGAVFTHPVIETDFPTFRDWATAENAAIYGSSSQGAVDLNARLKLQTPAVLLLGGERDGLSPEQAEACDKVLRIPMGGRGTSLNLAVAAGILMFDLQRAALGVQPVE